MKYIPINFDLIKSPLNWLIIILMLVIAAFAFDEIFRFVSPETDNGCGCHKSLFDIPPSTIAES